MAPKKSVAMGGWLQTKFNRDCDRGQKCFLQNKKESFIFIRQSMGR